MQNHTWTVIGENCIGFAYSDFELQTALVNSSLERYISIDNHNFQSVFNVYCVSLGPERGTKWPIDGIKRECSINLYFPNTTAYTIKQYKHLSNFVQASSSLLCVPRKGIPKQDILFTAHRNSDTQKIMSH